MRALHKHLFTCDLLILAKLSDDTLISNKLLFRMNEAAWGRYRDYWVQTATTLWSETGS